VKTATAHRRGRVLDGAVVLFCHDGQDCQRRVIENPLGCQFLLSLFQLWQGFRFRGTGRNLFLEGLGLPLKDEKRMKEILDNIHNGIHLSSIGTVSAMGGSTSSIECNFQNFAITLAYVSVHFHSLKIVAKCSMISNFPNHGGLYNGAGAHHCQG